MNIKSDRKKKLSIVGAGNAGCITAFDVVPTDCFKFDNYIAKNCFLGERTILNGNRLSFLEPLEATSTAFYLESCSIALKHIIYGIDKKTCNDNIRKEMFRIQKS